MVLGVCEGFLGPRGDAALPPQLPPCVLPRDVLQERHPMGVPIAARCEQALWWYSLAVHRRDVGGRERQARSFRAVAPVGVHLRWCDRLRRPPSRRAPSPATLGTGARVARCMHAACSLQLAARCMPACGGFGGSFVGLCVRGATTQGSGGAVASRRNAIVGGTGVGEAMECVTQQNLVCTGAHWKTHAG